MGYKKWERTRKHTPSFSFLKEVSLVEGMKQLMPIYHVLGKIPFVSHVSNKIIVLEKHI